MATKYSITFVNNHKLDGNYAFFTQKPIVNGNANDSKCFTNIWIANYVPDGGNVKITTTTQYYAWVGKSAFSPAPGITISGGMGKAVSLGVQGGAPGTTWPMVNFNGVPKLGTEGADGAPGCFEITTGVDFDTSDNFLLGLGQQDDNGLLVPAATIHADQNMATQILPIVKFYVSKSDAVQGQIVDFQSTSAVAGVIDFSTGDGQGKFGAIVTHDEHGSFHTTYHSLPNFMAKHKDLDRQLSKQNGARGDNSDLLKVQGEVDRLSQLVADLLQNSRNVDSKGVGVIQYAYKAISMFPVKTTAQMMVAGITIVTTTLAAKGYEFKMEKSSVFHGYTVYFGPKGKKKSMRLESGDPLQDATNAWLAAIEADDTSDGITDGGVTRNS